MTSATPNQLAELAKLWPIEEIKPRHRVITDNDYSGDPDGLVQLAHHLLSPDVEIRAVLGTHLREGDAWNGPGDTAAYAVEAAQKIVDLCGLNGKVPVIKGSAKKIADTQTPADSDAARFIVQEAMREDTDLPLFVVCGASLTEIASAYLMEPRIADRLTVVWIGGGEHAELAPTPKGAPVMEYNLDQDIDAGQVVFNHSNLVVWQVPRDRYRQVLASRAEMITRMATAGELGRYLFESLGKVNSMIAQMGMSAGEAYALGDSPLVLLTTLQSAFEPDTAGSIWVTKPCPTLNRDGSYTENPAGRPLRVYTRLDVRGLLEDLYAKLALHAAGVR